MKIPWLIRALLALVALSMAVAVPVRATGNFTAAFIMTSGVVLLLVALGELSLPAYLATARRQVSGASLWLGWGALGGGFLLVLFWWLLWSPPQLQQALDRYAAWSWSRTAGDTDSPDGTDAVSRRGRIRRGAGKAVVGANWLWNSDGPGQLPERIDLNLSNQLAAFLEVEDAVAAQSLVGGRAYLTAFRLAEFTECRWQTPQGRSLLLPADGSGWVWIGREPDLLTRAQATRYKVSCEAGDGLPLVALQGAIGLQRDRLRLDPGGNLIAVGGADRSRVRYSGISMPRLWGDWEAGAEILPGDPGELYRQRADGELGQVLGEIAAEIGPAEANARAQVRALRRFFRSNFSYSLETRNEDGTDPLINFLRFEPGGHCELFASAATLLAREFGLPSRMVYGFAHGQFLPGAGMFAFRDKHAHAWTEIYLEGRGWVIFDPTPAGAGAVPEATEEVPREDEERLTAAWLEEVGPPDEKANSDQQGSLWILAIGLGLVGVALVVLRCRAVGRASPAEANPAPGYLEKLRALARAKGLANASSLPVKELVQALRELGVEWPESADLTAYHYASRYEEKASDNGLEARLGKAIPGSHRSGRRPVSQ